MAGLSPDVKRKLALLRLADELGNVSRACRILDFHRDTYYEVRRAFESGGVDALAARVRAPGGRKRRIAAELEARVLARAALQPLASAESVARALTVEGATISASGVRGIWLRHGLETRAKRTAHAKRASAVGTSHASRQS